MGRSKSLDPRSSLAAALGSKVRRLREQHRWSQRDLAGRVYVSAARIAQIELATEPPSEALAADLDHALKAGDEINVAWWHMNRERHPGWARPYIDLEKRASRMRKYAPQLVPGILQTPAYAECLFKISQPGISARSVKQLVEARVARQSLLSGSDPLYLWAILDESIFMRPFGSDPSVMQGQLSHLLAATEAPNVVLQVLPLEAGAHGLMDGQFSFMDFPDGPSCAYTEGSAPGGEVVESQQAVTQYAMVYDQLVVKSLTPEASRDRLRATLEERY
ncbi:helix-turn-helix transcriptional regulator [Streptomyces sp. ODS28]|uniref:helix-turn-helix domain-containing protein n=1 Tax=Streptomyces sp. ODS28 TaxID=3136688 RepID=UPI0031EC9739